MAVPGFCRPDMNGANIGSLPQKETLEKKTFLSPDLTSTSPQNLQMTLVTR